MYRVKDWDSLYENNRSREVAELEWVPFKNQHDGDGFTELLDHPNGMAHFGAWVLLVQVASKCGKPAVKCGAGETPRGTLRRDNGKPHDARSIARMSGGDVAILEEAIPRFLDIGWLEQIPDDSTTCNEPQAGAVPPQAPAVLPQEGDDRARGRVPFSSIHFPEGGVGETTPGTAAVRATQADHDRAAAVAKLYPSVASKDKRAIAFSLEALNLLANRIAKNPEYPWERHAELEAYNPTPLGGQKWVMNMPNPVALERLRKAAPAPRREYYTAS